MLLPKNTKYRKQHKGRIHGNAKGNYELTFGYYGLKSLNAERVTARQIEASRRAITRFLKRAGRLWIRVFPDVPVTAKPAEVRMGKGKGSIDRWVCRVKPGTIMFEVDGVDKEEGNGVECWFGCKTCHRCCSPQALGGHELRIS